MEERPVDDAPSGVLFNAVAAALVVDDEVLVVVEEVLVTAAVEATAVAPTFVASATLLSRSPSFPFSSL